MHLRQRTGQCFIFLVPAQVNCELRHVGWVEMGFRAYEGRSMRLQLLFLGGARWARSPLCACESFGGKLTSTSTVMISRQE